MRSYKNNSAEEQHLLDQVCSLDLAAIGVRKVFFRGGGWITAEVERLQDSSCQLGPISVGEVGRYFQLLGYLNILVKIPIAREFLTEAASMQITQAYDASVTLDSTSFYVGSKIVNATNEFVDVSLRLEDQLSTLVFFSTARFRRKAPGFLDSLEYLIRSQPVQDQIQTELMTQSSIFSKDFLREARVANNIATAYTNLDVGELLNADMAAPATYSMAFLAAAATELTALLVAGRAGKRYFSYTVKYMKLKQLSVLAAEEIPVIKAAFVESAGGVEVVSTGVEDLRGNQIATAEIGISLF